MADPAAQSFRDDAERHGEILGSETDRVEAAIFADILASEEWVLGDVDTPSLTDLKAVNCPVCAVQKVGGLGDPIRRCICGHADSDHQGDAYEGRCILNEGHCSAFYPLDR